jgi:four helix bundle protein
MTTYKRFEDTDIWKHSRILCNDIYSVSEHGSLSKDYPLKDQMRRAAISIMSNVAEGFERTGNRELINFLSIAKGSCGELRSHLYLVKDRRYITEAALDPLMDRCMTISRMISGFMKYLIESDLKGPKFREEPATYGLEY